MNDATEPRRRLHDPPALPVSGPPIWIRGFTLVELLVAMAILVVAATISFLSFANVSKAWQKGTAMADRLHHGDFAMEQLAMALRSAYYPDTSNSLAASPYGFWLEDDGSGADARDSISWVKLGETLVGSDPAVAGAPHRIKVFIDDEDPNDPALAVKAWRPYAQPEDFDPEQLPSIRISKQILGMDFRVATNVANHEVEWEEEWEDTNRLPLWVEITLYLRPPEPRDPPVEMKRAVSIPVAPLSRR